MPVIINGTSGITDVDGTAAAPALTGTDTDTGIFFPAANTMAFSTAGTEDMRIDSAGNVGIGTASPTNKLTVANASSFVNIDLTPASGFNGGLNIKPGGTTLAAIGTLGNYTGGSVTDATVYAANNLAFLTGGATERMRIDSSGNVGIGTSSPTKTLTVYGVGDYTDEGSPLATFGSTATGSQRIYFGVNNTNGYTYIGSVKSGQAYSNLVLQPNGGNLLVGTTSQPVSTYRQVIQYSSNGGQGGIMFNDTDGGQTLEACYFRKDGSQRGYIRVTTSGTTYATVSDYRLKENVQPMSGALAKITALKPCTYTWKDSGIHSQGFVAHELAEVVPECVAGEKDAVDEDGNPKYQGIDTSFLVATLTAAIQELKAELDATKVEIAALKGQA